MSFATTHFKAAMTVAATTGEKKRPKKTVNPIHLFNTLAKCFFAQLALIFPHDATLEQLRKELERFAKNPKESHVPGVKFCLSMNNMTGISVRFEGKMVECSVGDMILMKDKRLFSDECKAEIPELDALSFKPKWATLNPEEQEVVWGYLTRMSEASANVYLSTVITKQSVMDMVDAVKGAGTAGKIDPKASPEEQVAAALSDPLVDKITSDLSKRIVDSRK